jgi:hypothetical protein
LYFRDHAYLNAEGGKKQPLLCSLQSWLTCVELLSFYLTSLLLGENAATLVGAAIIVLPHDLRYQSTFKNHAIGCVAGQFPTYKKRFASRGVSSRGFIS